MKQIGIILTSILLSAQLSAQSFYNQKWKESTYFSVPHSFNEKIKTDEHIVYEHEEQIASIEIIELGQSNNMSDEDLKVMLKDAIKEKNYSLEEAETEFPIAFESNFQVCSLLIRNKKKKAVLTALHSEKTNRNYVVVVEADQKYFKNNTNLIKQVSAGIQEF